MYARYEQRTHPLAIISLIAGIVAWLALPALGALIAIIAGHAARRDIRASRGLDTGGGLAMAGLILGWTQAVLILLAFLGGIVALVVAGLFGGFALLFLVLLGLLFLAGLLGLVSMFGFGLG